MTKKPRLVDGEWFLGPYRVELWGGVPEMVSDFDCFDALPAEARQRYRDREALRGASDQRAARDAVLRNLDTKEKAHARRKKVAVRRRKVPSAAKL